MANGDVEIIVRNIVEGEEEIAKLDTAYGKLDKTVKGELLGDLKKLQNEAAALKKKAQDIADGATKADKAVGGWGKSMTLAKGAAIALGATIGIQLFMGLKNFVKGSIDAAKAAGVAAGEFSELEKQTGRLKTQFGTALVGGGKGLSVIAREAGKIADNFEIANVSASKLADQGLQRLKAGTVIMTDLGIETVLVKDVIADMEGNILSASGAMDILGRAEEDAAQKGKVLEGALDGIEGRLDAVTLRATLWEIAQDRLNKELEELRGLMTPLSGDIEDFQTSIKGLREEEERLAEEFGLLEFLTPAQAEQIGQLKSDLTGVWILYQDIQDTIAEGNLGAGDLESAEEAAEALRVEMGILEAQIVELGGVPYVTQEQEEEARERLGEIRGQIDSVTAAWTRQANEMVFSLATQRLALGGFTDEEITALGTLAEGLGLIDPAQVAVLDAVAKASSKLAESGDDLQFAEDIEDIVDALSDPDISADELIETLAKIGEAGGEEGGLSAAVAQAEALALKLSELDGTTVDIQVNINETTTSGTSDGGGGGKEPEEGFAHGGAFTVPPGFGNDGFTAAFSSGETIAAFTPQQQFDQSRTHNGDNNFFGANTAEVFEMMEDADIMGT